MSDIKSYQRLLAVQAIYESSLNKEALDSNLDELLSHIIENVDFKNKVKHSKLLLTREIYIGVLSNLKKIDLILKSSLKNKNKVQTFDKLLLSIFRCAIYEIAMKKDVSKKILISEYLLVSNRFFEARDTALLNGVLDNLG
jgi:N utilization substance protein B